MIGLYTALLIPGAGNATTLREYPEVLNWIRAIHTTTTWITSCVPVI